MKQSGRESINAMMIINKQRKQKSKKKLSLQDDNN